MRYLLTLALIASAAAAADAQEKKKEQGPVAVVDLKRKDAVSYEKEVEPIFYKKCITCHSGSIKEGNLDLGSYEGLIKGGKRGSPLVPGKAADRSLAMRPERPRPSSRRSDPDAN